jgi:UDP-N-acetylmuramate--alanine ligase
VSSEVLVRLAREAGHPAVEYIPRRDDLAAWLDAQARPGDLVITLGAGNIQLVCNEVIALLEQRLGAATRKNLVRVDESSATVAR